MNGGCFNCGGPHFARDCPGTGNNGGGGAQGIRSLCSLKHANFEDKNMFQELETEDAVEEEIQKSQGVINPCGRLAQASVGGNGEKERLAQASARSLESAAGLRLEQETKRKAWRVIYLHGCLA